MGVEALSFFAGDWTGEGVAADGSRVRIRWSLSEALGGAWYVGRVNVEPLGVQGQDVWGRDPGGRAELIRVVVDSLGQLGEVRSMGWHGNELRWEGHVLSRGARVPVRQTTTRLGPDGFRAVWEAELPGRGWTVTSTETLRREAVER